MAGVEVGVMEILVVRRPAVGCIARLDGWTIAKRSNARSDDPNDTPKDGEEEHVNERIAYDRRGNNNV